MHIFLLALAFLVPLERSYSEIALMSASLEFDEADRPAIRWDAAQPATEYHIFAIDDQNDRQVCCVTSENYYQIDVEVKTLEVVAVQDGVLLATTGEIHNPRHTAGYPNFTQEQWLQIAPYLLPNTHPVKGKLDRLFRKKRYISSLESLKDGGFSVKGPGSGRTLTAKHKKLPDVLVKIFPDDEPIDELRQLMKRITGAQVARDIISQYHFEWLFKVPRKWIYILPQEPLATGPYPKSVVLIVEDMEVLPKVDNYPKWKSSSMTKAKLDAIYILLTVGGFNDLPLAFNMPFSKDGLLAIVDTEDYHKWPIPYDRLKKYLSDKMVDYWQELVNNGGPTGFKLNGSLRKLMKPYELHPHTPPAPISPE